MVMKRAELPGQADSEMISYPCMNSRCTYRHNGTGALLQKQLAIYLS
jgi:hypothetical protein